MTKGAHGRGGPPANPNSGRSEARSDGWTELPAKVGGRPPVFPLEGLTSAEKALWAVLWKKPQAAMWKKRGMQFQVAAYVRAFLEASAKGAPASLKTAVLRQEDSLGISLVGLAQLRWRIKDDDLAPRRTAPAAEVEKPAPVRRLRAAG